MSMGSTKLFDRSFRRTNRQKGDHKVFSCWPRAGNSRGNEGTSLGRGGEKLQTINRGAEVVQRRRVGEKGTEGVSSSGMEPKESSRGVNLFSKEQKMRWAKSLVA